MANELMTISQVMTLMVAAYRNVKLEPDTIRVYELALADVPPDALRAAVLHAVGKYKFFPTIAEIRDCVFELADTGRGKVTASEAWGNVMNAMDRFGYWRADQAVASLSELEQRACEAIGGFSRMCTADNESAERARFIEAYNGIAARLRTTERMLPSVRASIAPPVDRVSDPIKKLLETKRL